MQQRYMINFSIGRLHSAQTTLSGTCPVVLGRINQVGLYMKITKLTVQCRNKCSNVTHFISPTIKSLHNLHYQITFTSSHFSQSAAENSPSKITSIIAQNRHNLLKDGVSFTWDVLLSPGVPHAF